MNHKLHFHVGTKALILNETKEVLLLKSGPLEEHHEQRTFWDLPGGRIQEGQDIQTTLHRELKEELGIPENTLTIRELLDATIANFKADKEKRLSLLLLIYRGTLPKKYSFTLSDEHSEWRWTPLAETKKLLEIKFAKAFITKLDILTH